MKSLIIYHRVDYDGLFSMLVSKMYLEKIAEFGDEIEYMGWNYGDSLPNISCDLVQNYDRIIMVDISFPSDLMLELKKSIKYGVEVTWIDHHITAINDSITLGYGDLPGLRDNNYAAVENTWTYFYSDTQTPPIVQLLGTYDVWNLTRFNWEDLVLPLQFALKARYSIQVEKIFPDWPWLVTATFEDLEPIIESGKLILSYLRGTWNSAVKNFSWEVTVNGKYRGICCMSTEFSSNLFGAKSKEYDVMVVCNYKPAFDRFSISMYVDPDRMGDFHAGEYLKANYGGGGHKGAAGGFINQEQFLRLLNNKEI